MSEPIRAGDLVVVVKAKECGCADTIGRTFIVTDLCQGWRYCSKCRASDGRIETLVLGCGGYGFPVWRLKRIDPPAELEGTKETRELEVTQ